MKTATNYREECPSGSVTRMILALVLVLATFWISSCRDQAARWPERVNRSPEEMLADVIRWQQGLEVRQSVGELDFQCFTDSDLQVFIARDRPRRVVDELRSAPDFLEIAHALRLLPSVERTSVFEA